MISRSLYVSIILCWHGFLLAAPPAQIDDTHLSQVALPDESSTGQTELGISDEEAQEPFREAKIQLTAMEQCMTCPEYPTVRLTGFFQADVIWFSQDAKNLLSVGDAEDGADFRRARLAGAGKVTDNVSYMLEMDFAFPGRPSFMDVWLQVDDLIRVGQIRIGQFREPVGMTGQTSVKELTFIERPLTFAFLPFRQIGIMAFDSVLDERATWAVSVFRFPTDAYGENGGDNGGYGMATRVTALPVDRGNDATVHVGGSFSFADPTTDSIRYASSSEIFLRWSSPTPAFVDTGMIPTNSYALLGAEVAATIGPFHCQSELMASAVNQIGGGTAIFTGVCAQAAYILTGEHRPYNHKVGVLGRVVPDQPFDRNCRGHGAWEVAGRWSYLDFNDSGILGGRLNDLTLGLNWYLNAHTKFQFNYVHAFLDDPTYDKSDADIVASRAQVDF